MNGLSSTALQKTTNLAQPTERSAAVSSAVRRIVRPISAIASMFNPARVEPMLTDAQTRLVAARACGMAATRAASTVLMPFSTCVEKPPMKSTFTAFAARSRVSAIRTISWRSLLPAIRETGETAMRLLMMGSPNSRVSSLLTRRRSLVIVVTLPKTLRHSVSQLSLTQSNRLMPMVIVRMSSCSVRTISIVSRISSPEKVRCLMRGLSPLDPMHGLEDFLALDLDANRKLRSLARQPLAQLLERDRGSAEIDHHDHGEELPNNRLAYVEDVHVRLGNDVRNAGDDADPVGADDRHDRPARQGAGALSFLLI